MDKAELIGLLRKHKGKVQQLIKETETIKGGQIQAKATLEHYESLATTWFDSIEPELHSVDEISDETVGKYRILFGQILEIIDGRPSKQIGLDLLSSIESRYHTELIVAVQKYSKLLEKFPNIEEMLKKVRDDEREYLNEAIECAKSGRRRAAIVMGWCAAVNRMHMCVEKVGFQKFNEASHQMTAVTSGRFKRFNKKFGIASLSDLRMEIRDQDLLWTLEFLGVIDGNEHERLGICLTTRDTSAHPGDAKLSDENLLSFFSDIDKMIFSNPKFRL